jgi:Domain of unknown function (DUF5615)
MMARLYTNENFPLPVVEELRRLGHDVLTSREAGNAGRAIPDAEVLSFAAMEKRVLLTLNRRHFVRLHHETPEHQGIVVCTFDPESTRQAARIDAELKRYSTLSGQLLRINRPAS